MDQITKIDFLMKVTEIDSTDIFVSCETINGPEPKFEVCKKDSFYLNNILDKCDFFYESTLESRSSVAGFFIQRVSDNLRPSNIIQDDNYIPMLRKIFGIKSRIITACSRNYGPGYDVNVLWFGK